MLSRRGHLSCSWGGEARSQGLGQCLPRDVFVGNVDGCSLHTEEGKKGLKLYLALLSEVPKFQ